MKAFFFAEDDPRLLAVVRMALGAILVFESAARWRYSVELYSSDGLTLPIFPGMLEPPALSATATVALQSLQLFLAWCILAGWRTRVSLLLSAVLGGWLGLLDVAGTFKKYSVISLHLQILMACGQPAATWSLDAIGHLRAGQNATQGEIWPRRLMQCLVCWIYFGAAVTKLRLPDFFTGDMLEFVLLDDLWGGKRLGLWLADQRELLVWGGLSTLAFELVFPVLVWFSAARRPLLIVGLAFHLSLAITMQLGIFSWMMMAALLSFLASEDLDALAVIWPRLRLPPDAWPAPPLSVMGRKQSGRNRVVFGWGAFAVVGALFAAGSVACHRHWDWYGAFGNVRPPAFREMSRDEVDAIRTSPAPFVSHYVHRLELGSRMANSRVFGPDRIFPRGASVHALARFLQRKPRMKLAWVLVAPDGAEVARERGAVEPGTVRMTVAFELPEESPPGRYRVVLQLDDYDAAERSFDVIGDE